MTKKTKINEVSVEKNSIVKYFTDDINGLGYKEESKSIVSKDLFIKKDILAFLKTSQNIKNFNEILKKEFKGNEINFYNEYIKVISNEINSQPILNVAFLFNKEITFKNKKFTLFSKTDYLRPNKSHSKNNIFTVVRQFSCVLLDENKTPIKNTLFEPDLTFFLNGIYFGYLELKFNTNGQNAKDNGIQQIITKYRQSYEIYLDRLNYNVDQNLKKIPGQTKYYSALNLYKKNLLRIFTSPLFLSAFDIHSLYMIRDFKKIENYINSIETDLIYGLSEFNQLSKKEFKEYPNQDFDWKTLLKNLYSKENIENEICFYNFSEKPMKLNKQGKYKAKTDNAILISPRPKQKFGTDTTIKLAKEMIDYEKDDNYWKIKLQQQIKDLPKKVQEKVIEERQKFKNNKYVNSILLAYAAGFGKTNCMGWITLLLKNLVAKDETNYAFDTIYLITDRLELKTQIANKMKQMEIDKGMIKVVENKLQFKEALTNNYRIVIVNIQKFQTIKSSLTKDIIDKLRKKRNAFIIDEIHRSNSGSQHEDMMSMFSNIISNDKIITKNVTKNLIIGLTATPTEETLLRFGKYAGCDGTRVIFKPHDEYTMQESINDGYTLDFSKSITPISIKMNFYIDEKINNDVKESLEKKKIYENKDRIKAVCDVIIYNLLDNVYKQIKGQGKAMLSCYSIKAAILHHKYLNEALKKISKEKKYQQYKDSEILIVYSENDSENIPKAKLLNKDKDDNTRNEKTVINDFKNNKNGLIIVVDKLQTGFDEPKLHTLFLNKEITGLMAIQAPARINRTMKNKFSCHIIDFSHNNINYKTNIPKALSIYQGVQYSKTNIRSPYEQLKKSYNFLIKEQIYKNFYNKFNKTFYNDENEYLKVEKDIIIYQKNHLKICKKIEEEIFFYFQSFKLLNNIVDIDDYYNEEFITFYKKLLNIFRKNNSNGNGENKVVIDVDFENIGKILENTIISTPNKKSNSKKKQKTNESNLIDILNEKEELKEEQIKEYKKFLNLLFEKIIKYGENEQKNDIKAKILDGTFSDEDNENLFILIVKKLKRRYKKDDIIPEKFYKSIIDYKPNAYIDFYQYVLKEN